MEINGGMLARGAGWVRSAAAVALVASGVLLAIGARGAAGAQAGSSARAPTPADGGLSLIVEPNQGLTAIDRDVAAARSSVDLTMYELDDATIEQELAADARRGVRVRVLLNGGYYGRGGFPENDAAAEYLRAHGVAVRSSPAVFALTHQKTVTIDGRTSLVMTLNLTSRYYASSRDFAVVDTQPADVAAIEAVFDADWDGTPIIPSTGSGDLVWSPGALGAQLALIAGARSTLAVENEEMDDSDVVAALCAAARRGVGVHVVMTYAAEWRSALQQLAACGVAVRTYAQDAALYIHAKAIVVDGREAFVGSQNFSWTSLQANRELGIVTTDTAIVGGVAATLAGDYAGASAFGG
jgi:phosphatidylserine/phosphatidylglycerophosphate/cardiolipin synthase-like enzyme